MIASGVKSWRRLLLDLEADSWDLIDDVVLIWDSVLDDDLRVELDLFDFLPELVERLFTTKLLERDFLERDFNEVTDFIFLSAKGNF